MCLWRQQGCGYWPLQGDCGGLRLEGRAVQCHLSWNRRYTLFGTSRSGNGTGSGGRSKGVHRPAAYGSIGARQEKSRRSRFISRLTSPPSRPAPSTLSMAGGLPDSLESKKMKLVRFGEIGPAPSWNSVLPVLAGSANRLSDRTTLSGTKHKQSFFSTFGVQTIMATIVALRTFDIRFPTSRGLDGSDAMNPDPDYSAAYVELSTDDATGLAGYGLVFTIGRGNDVQAAAIQALSHLVCNQDVDEMVADLGAFARKLTDDSQLRWLGPEKGVMHMAIGSVINAAWDLAARRAGKNPCGDS